MKSKCIKKCTRDYLGPHEVLRPLPLSGYVETHPDRGRGTGPLPLSGCVSTYPDRGRGTLLNMSFFNFCKKLRSDLFILFFFV